ncbi:MAG: response regulator [Burkholderiales bacterium]|nr:response regulator [Burkholderiales bacterium]
MLEQLQQTLNVYLIPFVIAVPIAILLLLAARREHTPGRSAGPAATPTTAPARILVVDDSAVARAKLRKLFENAGHVVEIAHDGIQALAQLQQGRYAVLVTDLEMPNMNGIELIAAVQANLDTEDLPIVAITGHEELQARVHDCQGLYGIFKKPWNDRELLKRIEALVSLRPSKSTA